MTPADLPETDKLVIAFDFLCFDAENRRETDAEIVPGVDPSHACQEYVAALEAANNEINRRPYIVAVKPKFREASNWDLYKVTPTVSVSYPVSQPTQGEIAVVIGIQARGPLPPIQSRPPEHQSPDTQPVSHDPADDALGLNAQPTTINVNR